MKWFSDTSDAGLLRLQKATKKERRPLAIVGQQVPAPLVVASPNDQPTPVTWELPLWFMTLVFVGGAWVVWNAFQPMSKVIASRTSRDPQPLPTQPPIVAGDHDEF